VFKIHPSTLRDWDARYKAGSLKPSYPKTRRARKLPLDKLESCVNDNPDAFLSEIGEHFDCSAEAVRKALIKLNITLKKRPSATKNAAKLNEPNMSKR
jgi:transposase